MYVLIVGNVIDGVRLYGTFNLPEEAAEWAEAEIKNEHWDIAFIQPSDKKSHARRAITEAIVKGLGNLWSEPDE